jgi:hypothetical protein
MWKWLSSLVLWLFVIVLGIAFGAGIYESRIIVPLWAASPPETWQQTGLQFWAFVTTGPLTLLTALSFIAAWRDTSARRWWWMTAAVIVAAERVATFAYFIPTIVELQTGALPPATVAQELFRWSSLNYVRHVATLLGWLAALRALSLSSESGGTRRMFGPR